jgi:hypothetical protein
LIAPPKPQHAPRQVEIGHSASGVQQSETNPRQHEEDDTDAKDKLRRDPKERTNEDLTCSAMPANQCD